MNEHDNYRTVHHLLTDHKEDKTLHGAGPQLTEVMFLDLYRAIEMMIPALDLVD